MRILITGAAGQLGADVRRVCDAAGDDVTACDRMSLDVTDRDQVLQVLGAVRPQTVVHCATFTSVDGCELDPRKAFAVNSLGARHVAEAATIVGARVIHVSTDFVFDGRGAGLNGGEPYTEWDPTGPISTYGRSKLGGEQEMVALLGPAATIVRTAWLCGANGHNFVKTMLGLAHAPGDAPVDVVDDQRGCPSFTFDVAATIRALAAARVPGCFHVTNAGEATWWSFASAVFAEAGHDPGRVRAITTAELHPPRPAPRPAYSVLANVALAGLGVAALPPWESSLERLVGDLR